ncbi:MAG: ABC transporter permease, partial [Ferruginibacter sp.]|nr:ABC transporter permease [Cytophagales bacterium]
GLRIKTNAGAGFVRKGLVVAQFAVSMVLMIGTGIVYQQVQHVKDRPLGYDRQNLIYLDLRGNLADHFSAVKSDLLATGVVENAATSNSTVLELGSNGSGWAWPGKDPTREVLITQEGVSPEYLTTMGMQLRAGRDFYPNAAADSNHVIINETLAQLIARDGAAKNVALDRVVGNLLTDDDGAQFNIVGVIKDFSYNNMYTNSIPLILFCNPEGNGHLTVRFKPGVDLRTALAKVAAVVKTNNPGYPFEYKFVDEEFDRYFRNELLIGKLAAVFALLAVFISCLGLFGLAAYTAERRTKEIGIRKVLGASALNLAGLLSKDFIRLVAIACLVAFPVAWWAMGKWLEDYTYRTPLHWWLFGLAGGAALLIALLTVSFQAIKAALTNPVKSLRTE